ncbi:uncharacterized protein LOC135484778 [Lineus longissimus]|uniref:uncharacterized protein LOC135484778 n=1 Tax=Lineus longissimus TaxID=88925 RepID=UPI00315D9F54
MFNGDTPASNFIGGFKESVGSAHRPCRKCLIVSDQLTQIQFAEESEERSLASHNDQLSLINRPGIDKTLKQHFSKLYGINRTSVLAEVPFFDVTTCLPQDAMHVILEGTLNLGTKLMLNDVMKRGLLSIEKINDFITGFPYPKDRDKPSLIEQSHITSASQKLRQSSAQMLSLGFSLPFLMSDVAGLNEDDKHLACFLLLLKICSIGFTFEVSVSDSERLRYLIGRHHEQFRALYPDNIVRKHHFMPHFPRQMLMFGPLRYSWCMRFEGLNCLEKGHVLCGKNFKNVAKTIAMRHQEWMCLQLAKTGDKSHYLYAGDQVKDCGYLPIGPNILEQLGVAFPEDNIDPSNLALVRKLIIHGRTYE